MQLLYWVKKQKLWPSRFSICFMTVFGDVLLLSPICGSHKSRIQWNNKPVVTFGDVYKMEPVPHAFAWVSKLTSLPWEQDWVNHSYCLLKLLCICLQRCDHKIWKIFGKFCQAVIKELRMTYLSIINSTADINISQLEKVQLSSTALLGELRMSLTVVQPDVSLTIAFPLSRRSGIRSSAVIHLSFCWNDIGRCCVFVGIRREDKPKYSIPLKVFWNQDRIQWLIFFLCLTLSFHTAPSETLHT